MIHGRHFVRRLGICNPICVKLLQIIFGVIPRNLKKKTTSISNRFPEVHKRGIHTDTHTDTQTHTDSSTYTHRHTQTHTQTHTDTHRHANTQDDSIRRNAMRCISSKMSRNLEFAQDTG